MRIKEKVIETEHAERMKDAFLHNINHEIRTPLNSILGFMQLLDTDVTPDEHDLFVRIIHQNTELLVHMIDNMLLMASLESGEYQIKRVKFDISALMHDLADNLHDHIHDGLELKVNVHEPLHVYLDPNSLIRVLKSLILNAEKFTLIGKIIVDYSVDGEMLNVSVADTGIGIAVEDRKRIFGKFEKLNKFSQGLGLGLPICKAIVEKLGGRIQVESEPGCGSTFRFSLPLNSNRLM